MERKFELSQSSLKSFEDPSVCLEDFRRIFISKQDPPKSSIYMDFGRYFEYLCIGSGSGHQEDIKDLPRKKNGEKKVSQERIELQANLFKNFHNECSHDFKWFEIIETQKKIKFNRENGIIDIVAKDFFTDEIFLIDLKLTSDLKSNFNKKFTYDKNINITQAIHYVDLWENLFKVRPIFSYFVFDYSPNMNFRRIDVDVSDDDIIDLIIRKKEFMSFVDEHYTEKCWKKYCTCSQGKDYHIKI